MSKSVVVVTKPELGWDCVVGVFDSMDDAEVKYPSDDYIKHEKELQSYSVYKPSDLITFDESKHMQILDGGFCDVDNNPIEVTPELIDKCRRLLQSFDSEYDIDLVWDDEFEYYYPAIVNCSTKDFGDVPVTAADLISDGVNAHLRENEIYFW